MPALQIIAEEMFAIRKGWGNEPQRLLISPELWQRLSLTRWAAHEYTTTTIICSNRIIIENKGNWIRVLGEYKLGRRVWRDGWLSYLGYINSRVPFEASALNRNILNSNKNDLMPKLASSQPPPLARFRLYEKLMESWFEAFLWRRAVQHRPTQFRARSLFLGKLGSFRLLKCMSQSEHNEILKAQKHVGYTKVRVVGCLI